MQYSSNKAKSFFGFSGPDWEQRTITGFDSVLNRWADSVPDHCEFLTRQPSLHRADYRLVRWDPTREDDVFFIQSAHLWAQYYELQIVVHRPFISPQKRSPLSFPSLAICANAARSCSHVVDHCQKRFPDKIFPFLHVRHNALCKIFEVLILR